MTNPEKAYASIKSAGEYALSLKFHLDTVAHRLVTGADTKIARAAMNDALLDLRLMVGDVDAYVRLAEAEIEEKS